MTLLILTEKPSQARKFAETLNATPIYAKNGKSNDKDKKTLIYYEGKFEDKTFRITNALGHLMEFPKSPHEMAVEGYEDYFKIWDLKNLPWDISKLTWKKRPKVGNHGQLSVIKKASEGCDAIAIATDVDPSGEGELLGWEIINAIGWKKKVFRLFHVETDKTIQKGFNNLIDITDQEKDGDYIKAKARDKWDYISIQLTRATTLLAQSRGYEVDVIPEGRLKSVIVYLVGKRLDEIKNYVRKPYYTVKYKDENGNIYENKEIDKFETEGEASTFLEAFPASKVNLDKTTRKKTSPPALLNLSQLASIVATKGIKTDVTLKTYQNLYENQIVSYPRTDDKFVNQEQFEELLNNLKKISAVVNVDMSLLTHTQPRKTHVGDAGPHGANRPGLNVPNSLNQIEKVGTGAKEIYELLAKNSLAMFAEDYEYDSTKAYVNANNLIFSTISNEAKIMGWKSFYTNQVLDEDETNNSSHPIGKEATSFVYEGANKKPNEPTIKWVMKLLEKFNVGTGATRTKAMGDLTSGNNPSLTEKKGKLGLTEIGGISYILLEGSLIGNPKQTEILFNAMEDVGKFKRSASQIIESAIKLCTYDIEVFKKNVIKLPEVTKKKKKEYVPKEKHTGIYLPSGKTITFTKVWGGHLFTEDEIATLLSGKSIVIKIISHKTKKEILVSGKFEQQEYNKTKYWGFKPEYDKNRKSNKK